MSWRAIIATVLLATFVVPADAAGLAWRVTDDDGRKLYLVGTVHAASAEFYPLPAPIEQAFAEAGVVVFEVDPTRVDGREAQRLTQHLGWLPDGQRLRQMLSDDGWERISAWAARHGLDERRLNRMRPWLAATTLVVMEMHKLGIEPAHGMERHLAARAVERDLAIVELESLDEQLRTLAALSDEAQVYFLENAMTTYDEFAASVRHILDSWTAGDDTALTELLHTAYGPDTELYDLLILRRNRAWLPEIEGMLASGTVHFVAVGTLHMVGDDGLVELLRCRGWRLERL